jgi:hypothetical protein
MGESAGEIFGHFTMSPIAWREKQFFDLVDYLWYSQNTVSDASTTINAS